MGEEVRRPELGTLSQTLFDLVVIGGGITGAATARDAALRGLSVLLVEKDDFAAGTSSRSSKLIHGGLRYLETYQFRLVAESVRERERMLTLAPHLTERETEILKMVAKGMSYKQIAERLVLSHRTVQNHVQNTLRTLQMHNRVELTRYAIEQGLDDDD